MVKTKATSRKRYRSSEYVEDPNLGFSIDASAIDPEIMKDPVKLLQWLGSSDAADSNDFSFDAGEQTSQSPHYENNHAVESKTTSSSINNATKQNFHTRDRARVTEKLSLASHANTDVPWEVSYLRDRGIRCVDFRPRGGSLWAFGNYSIAVEIGYLRSCGLKFHFKAEGSGITQGNPGWWTNDESPARPVSQSVSTNETFSNTDASKKEIGSSKEPEKANNHKIKDDTIRILVAAISMAAKTTATDAVITERPQPEELTVSRLALQHALEEYQVEKKRGFANAEDAARAFSKTIAIAYKANPPAANKIWNDFQPLKPNATDKVSHRAVIQLFDSLTTLLPYSDVVNLVMRDKDRLKVIVQCDYQDTDQLSALCKIFIGLLRAGNLDGCDECLRISGEPFSSSMDSLSIALSVKLSAVFTANALVISGDKASEQALKFLRQLAKNSSEPVRIAAQASLYLQSKTANHQGNSLLSDSSRIGLVGFLEDLLWKQRMVCSEGFCVSCLQQCVTKLGESKYLPGANIVEARNIYEGSKLEYFVHLANTRSSVALQYCACPSELSEELIRLWIMEGNWSKFTDGLVRLLQSSKEPKFIPSMRMWRLLKLNMDMYLDKTDRQRKDRYGRNLQIIDDRNVSSFVDAVKSACSKAGDTSLASDLRSKIADFEQKAMESKLVMTSSSMEISGEHSYAHGLSDDELSAPLAVPELVGILFGISCDGRVNEKEANTLKAWLSGVDAKGDRRILYVKDLLERTLADGVIDEEEEQELLTLFNKIIDFAMGVHS